MDAHTHLCPHCRQPMPQRAGRKRLEVDIESFTLVIDGERIRVTRGMALTAEAMAVCMPRAAPRLRLLEAATASLDTLDRTIDSHIKRIRRLTKHTQLRIETIYGIGYRFYFADEETPGAHPSVRARETAAGARA